MINDIIVKYSVVDSSLGYIDLGNHDIANIYKRKGNVYNIISWRSITYLKNFVIAMAKLGIDDEVVIRNVCAGMIGLGSNNFKSEDQVESFITLVSDHVKQIIDSSVASEPLDFDVSDKLSDLIHEYIAKLESTKTLGSTKYENALVDIIVKKYGDFAEVYKELSKNDEERAREFVNDMDSIAVLINKVSSANAAIIANIHQSCSSMYNDVLGTNENFSKDVYGVYTPQMIRKVILGKDKKDKICRVGVFGSSGNSYVVIPNGVDVSKATLSRLIREDCFEKLSLNKIL